MRRGPQGFLITVGVICVLAAGGAGSPLRAQRSVSGPSVATTPPSSLIDEYRLSCHDEDHKKGGLALDVIEADAIDRHPEAWEKVVRKLRARQMPPIGKDRPDDAAYDAAIASLETSLDRAAAAHPNPGRTATLRRLTRTEYQNAVRDLLAIEIDAASLLPADESSYGFDNVNSGNLSPTLLDRYVSAAEKISRVAVGRPSRSPGGETIRIPAELTQEEHIEGLPIGTRGGALVHYTFPQDGEYDIQVRLMRDRDEHVEGLSEPHEVELLLDRARLQVYTVKPPQREAGVPDTEQPSHEKVDQHLKMRVTVDGRSARRRRRVSQEAVGAPRDGTAALRNALQLLPAPADPAGDLFDLDRRSLCRHRPGRHAEPPPALRLASCVIGPAEPGRSVRADDPGDADAARLSPSRHRRRSSRSARVVSCRARPAQRRGLRGGDRDRRCRPSS